MFLPLSRHIANESYTYLLTYHELGDGEQNRSESGERLLAVCDTVLTLQPTSVHSHVPVGQLIDELDEARENSVESVR